MPTNKPVAVCDAARCVGPLRKPTAQERVVFDLPVFVGLAVCTRCGSVDLHDRYADRRTRRRAEVMQLVLDAKRTYDVLVASQQALGMTREQAREDVNRLVAQWLGRQKIRAWWDWSEADARRILQQSVPLLTRQSHALLEGDDRVRFHAQRAKLSRFPRLAFGWRVWRDRVATRLRAAGAAFLAVTRPRDER